MSLFKLTHEFDDLKLGYQMPKENDDGRTVIAKHKLWDYQYGSTYATWLAITVRDGVYHPYSVHTVVARPEGFVMYHGNYFFTLTDALAFFKREVADDVEV